MGGAVAYFSRRDTTFSREDMAHYGPHRGLLGIENHVRLCVTSYTADSYLTICPQGNPGTHPVWQVSPNKFLCKAFSYHMWR